MDFVLAVIVVLGGAATFVYGLKLLGEGTEKLVGAKLKKFVAGCVEKPFGGFLAGAAVAGVTQSSAAVTMVAVGLAEAGAITFLQAAPVVMGANVGTTVTAQFIAIFGRGGDYKSAVGALAAAAGVIFGFFKNKTLKNVGDALVGFGLMLSGLSALSGRINALKSYDFLSGFAYVDNPFLLFLFGAAVAAVTQSSSAITGILITFSENSFAAFYRAIFIITGSNVGSCAAVILSSANKSEPAREAAVFNFVFNAFGAILFSGKEFFAGNLSAFRNRRGQGDGGFSYRVQPFVVARGVSVAEISLRSHAKTRCGAKTGVAPKIFKK